MAENKIIITLDGQSGCGKSSTARAVAEALHYAYIDTGAMYRATTYFFLQHKIDLSDTAVIKEALQNMSLKFVFNESNKSNEIWLNDENIEGEIRKPEVSNKVSEVAAISVVRKEMVAQQRQMGVSKGIVMDGRDIGSVVFPSAELKVFMKADLEIRAQRRLLELDEKGIVAEFEEIKNNLAERDRIDSTREDSPLVIPEGAFELDTSNLSFEQQVEKIINLAKQTISKSIESRV